jgi:hypothetical protein
VKMNGNIAEKFKIKIKRNIDLIKIFVLLGNLIINFFVSLLILFIIIYFLLCKNLYFIMKVNGSRRVIQAIFNKNVEGSNIENKFIINFKI